MKGMNRVKRGRGFRGVLDYIFGRDKEHKTSPGMLVGGNMSGYNPQSLAQEFGVTRRLRPDIEKPVWHNSLRLPAGESLSNDEWSKIADNYMEEMGFCALHQRCYVLHDDNDGQHIHIVASRIALDGSLYLGKNENLASTRIIQQLEIVHGLTITKGPEYENGKIKMPEVKNISKTEMEKGLRLEIKPPRVALQELLNATIQEPKTAIQFVQFLEDNGVIVMPNLASTGRLNGFSFGCDGLSFKGSSLGDAYKWSNLSKAVQYDKDRDFAELAKRKPVVGNDIGNSSGIESVTGNSWQTDLPVPGTFGQAGSGVGPGLGYPESHHGTLDPADQRIPTEPNSDIGTGQGSAHAVYGTGTAPEGHAIQPGGKRMDERSEGITGTKGRDAGAHTETQAAVSDSDNGGRDALFGLGLDDPGEDAVMAWNTRFKQAAAAKLRHQELPDRDCLERDRQAKFQMLCEMAHKADLVAYMKAVSLDVKKDGVKDYVVDDRYRVTRKQDGHFVWCSWDQSRGGDTISFCTEELGLSFQQALADLGGGRLSPVTKPHGISHVDRFPTSPPVSRDPDAVLAYLEGRGISRSTIRHAQGAGFLRFVDYQGVPAAAFCGWDGDRRLRFMTVRLVQPVLSCNGKKEITKIDVRHSDKAFPALWRGGDPVWPSDGALWVVEGGTDALAVMDWYRSHRVAAPSILVSGGAGVRRFLEQPHVQDILKKATTVYLSLENEKNQKTQIETDQAHLRQVEIIQSLGCTVVLWRPPFGAKDVAEAWKTGTLPDIHNPLAHMPQVREDSVAAKTTQARQQQALTSTPTSTPFD
ncbi:relaxase/mobilization nuclease domain-containing protein [Acidithiobacillus ferriphilus]|uniref:relaxase/mobilization nuclease domain-containing protein n=1 Tax=Acidithiobacillus ferriphilus TaxID=1689834 RepID=UPI003F512171